MSPWVREERPDSGSFITTQLNDESWQQVYKRAPGVILANWSMHNNGTQNIQYAYSKGAQNFGLLAPDGRLSEDTNPKEIWVRRSSSASAPTIRFEFWTWSKEPGGGLGLMDPTTSVAGNLRGRITGR